MDTIVLQSHAPHPQPDWIALCLTSVREWATARGYAYRLIHDELFDGLPQTLLNRTTAEGLPRTDFGRLLWIERLHREGWRAVVWLDADVAVFDRRLEFGTDAVAKEAWISRGPRDGWRVVKKVNNCAMRFAADSPTLARYLDAARVEDDGAAGALARMAIGPDLLTRMHAEAPLPLHDHVAMFSPRIIEALAGGEDSALSAHAAAWRGDVYAANLCASLGLGEETMLAATRRLLSEPEVLRSAPATAPPADLSPWRGAPLIW